MYSYTSFVTEMCGNRKISPGRPSHLPDAFIAIPYRGRFHEDGGAGFGDSQNKECNDLIFLVVSLMTIRRTSKFINVERLIQASPRQDAMPSYPIRACQTRPPPRETQDA